MGKTLDASGDAGGGGGEWSVEQFNAKEWEESVKIEPVICTCNGHIPYPWVWLWREGRVGV